MQQDFIERENARRVARKEALKSKKEKTFGRQNYGSCSTERESCQESKDIIQGKVFLS
jgi:hypothetical protein